MTRSPTATPGTPARRRSAARRLAALALAVGLVPACGSTPPSRFYVLAPSTELTFPEEAPSVHIGLEPVVMPSAVDRTQMVVVVSPHERRVSELDRWAEPLREGATRLVALHLESHFGATSVVVQPARNAPAVDCSVSIEVLTFDARPCGTSELTARVRARAAGGWTGARLVRSTFTDRTGGEESRGAAVARALSETLRTVSDAAADLVREAVAATSADG